MQPDATTAELLSRLLDSVDGTASLAAVPDAGSSHHPSPFPLFAALVSRLSPILHALLQHQPDLADTTAPTAATRKSALDSLDADLRRARSLAGRSSSSSSPAVATRLLEGAARSLARGVRALAGAWADAPAEIREEMEALQRELMEARFAGPADDWGGGSGLVDTEDLVVRIKNGDEDELWVVMFEIEVLICEGLVGEEGGTLIPSLLNRLALTKSENRLKMILVLRRLASYCTENKVAI